MSQSICIFLLPVMRVLRYEIPSLVMYDSQLKGVLFKCDPLCCPSTPPPFFCLTCCVIVIIHLLLSVERFSLQKESELAHVSDPLFFFHHLHCVFLSNHVWGERCLSLKLEMMKRSPHTHSATQPASQPATPLLLLLLLSCARYEPSPHPAMLRSTNTYYACSLQRMESWMAGLEEIWLKM